MISIPLSVAQQGLWLLCQADDRASAAYNTVVALRRRKDFAHPKPGSMSLRLPCDVAYPSLVATLSGTAERRP